MQAQALCICYYGLVMRVANLETLAERWTIAHTIAVAAWVAVVVLGLMLFVKTHVSTYPAVKTLKVYAAENATFEYPSNWTVNNCVPGKSFMELPGTIKTDFKRKGYQLKMYGTTAFNCIKDRPERLDLYPEELAASNNPCAPATSTDGERLSNGLYLQLQQEGGSVLAVNIKQNSCYAPADTLVLGFGFTDPKPESGDSVSYGIPRVKKETFLASRQYLDIKAVAESIKY
jgi:hypothetical protein